MIPFFPDPYPDELLYSVCARYSDRVQYGTPFHIMQDLFGNKSAKATVDLPSRLSHLVSVLPPGHPYTVERLIDDHTMLPFYSPFCPSERVNRVRENMRGDKGWGIHSRLGILYNRRQNWLRFCPVCVQEDRLRFGESYWHRLHQAPGVEVCPVHAVFLEESQARIRHHVNIYRFISAESVIKPTSPLLLNLSDPTHEALLKIAHDAAWLMSQRGLVCNVEFLHNRYSKLLADQGLATYQGTVSNPKLLVAAFKNFYSADLLSLLNCSLDNQHNQPWLMNLRQKRTDNIRHPIRHLLLIQFLGYTVAEFFQMPNEFKPFGDPPWPCLNPICFHFKQPQIEKCLVNYSREVGRKPIGTFECNCGFVYSRQGPDLAAEARFELTRVKSYGELWDVALKNLWSDPEVTVSEIARRLGFSHRCVAHQAKRLGLSFPRRSNRSIRMTHCPKSGLINSVATHSSRLETYRQEWLEARVAFPDAGRTLISRKFPRIYSWLSKHDPLWLEDHKPPRQRHSLNQPNRSCVDWETRDAHFAAAILTTSERLLNAPFRPQRITKAVLGREIEQLTKINGNLDKLPMTAKVLAEVVETAVQVAVRRLEWVTERFRSENVYPTPSQLKRRASIQKNVATNKKVQKAIEDALASFNLVDS
ncbi:MAG: TnsD family transposase [Coleofasciculus sp. S288]|nr:TnsD family transposase [Coleofasciculus sp. S288]